MIISVEPRDSFDVEPGRYRATCTEVREIEKQTRKGTEKFLRLIWELDIPGLKMSAIWLARIINRHLPKTANYAATSSLGLATTSTSANLIPQRSKAKKQSSPCSTLRTKGGTSLSAGLPESNRLSTKTMLRMPDQFLPNVVCG